MLIHGSAAVASQAVKGFRLMFANPAAEIVPVLVNGSAGVVVTVGGQPLTVIGFTVSEGKITRMDAIADPGRVGSLTATVLTRRAIQAR